MENSQSYAVASTSPTPASRAGWPCSATAPRRPTRRVDELNTRIITLEHARWPLPAVAALTAVGALVVAIWQALGR